MARVVDQGRKRARDNAINSLAMARNYVATMKDKCAELEAITRNSVGGHVIGDQMALRIANSVDQLAQSEARLREAGRCAQGIDVTIEVPDPEQSYG